MKRRCFGIAMRVCFLFAFVPAVSAAHAGQKQKSLASNVASDLPPIPAKWAKAFSAMRPDPRPERLTRDSHYWVSDEQRHDLFRKAIANKGGVFVGLGTDQNYLMAGWSRPEVLVPLDFDEMVVLLHYAFRAIFLHADEANQFIKMWSEDEKLSTLAVISKVYGDNPDFSAKIQKAFKKGRRRVHPRLKRIRRAYGRLGVPTYLTDPVQYRYLVDLFRTDRVFPIRGDLTATMSIKDVAKATRRAGLTVRVLYLSNAEQYFKYSGPYRQNMAALPFDERSVVIRTAGKRTEWAADGLYEYIVQAGLNFQTWIVHPKTYNVWTLVAARTVNKKTGGSVIETLPAPVDDRK